MRDFDGMNDDSGDDSYFNYEYTPKKRQVSRPPRPQQRNQHMRKKRKLNEMSQQQDYESSREEPTSTVKPIALHNNTNYICPTCEKRIYTSTVPKTTGKGYNTYYNCGFKCEAGRTHGNPIDDEVPLNSRVQTDDEKLRDEKRNERLNFFEIEYERFIQNLKQSQ